MLENKISYYIRNHLKVFFYNFSQFTKLKSNFSVVHLKAPTLFYSSFFKFYKILCKNLELHELMQRKYLDLQRLRIV